jgi:FkbH-like protein
MFLKKNKINSVSFIVSAQTPPPTSRGSSAGSSHLTPSLDPAHKARDVGGGVWAETMNKAINSLPTSSHQLLDYPLDAALILRKKHAIKKELIQNEGLISKKIAILGGSTTSEIKAILELFLLNSGIKPEFYESEYGRYYEEAVFENKMLSSFKPDIIYLHITNKNIVSFPSMTDSTKDIELIFQQEQAKYKNIWSKLNQYHCPIIQNNFELPQQRILGNLDAYDPRGAIHYINRLNSFFVDEAQTRSNLYLNDINYLAATLGLAQWFDKHLWYSSRYALSYEAIPHLAKSLSAIMGGLFGMSKKAVILDLDNTCWGGNIGDEGVKGIIIGKETALAEVYSDFQRYVKLLKKRGIILAASSKNDQASAQEGFSHPDTVLVLEDFAAFEANWEPKSKTIVKISEELNLGLDSFVFIDDSPSERQIVRDNLPMVSVPDIGSEVLYFIDYLDKNYYFETVSVSPEDVNRAGFYKKKTDIAQHKLQCVDYAAYLKSLSMVADIQAFSSVYLSRITQLINKTHQFNLTNKRYVLVDIELIAQNSNYITQYGRLEDCYGDHGLISVIIGRIQDHECHIELWTMSCRVLKRTMEHAMLDALVAQCRAIGIETIVGYYYKSAKNGLVAKLYEDYGFVCIATNSLYSTWRLQLDQYTNKNVHIKVIK